MADDELAERLIRLLDGDDRLTAAQCDAVMPLPSAVGWHGVVRPLQVVKVGGSLFDVPTLPDRLRTLLGASVPKSVLLAGGGEIVEAIRRLDEVHGMAADVSHQLALQGMSLNAAVLARLLQCPIVTATNPVQVRQQLLDHDWIVVDALPLLSAPEVPIGWNVTSDSLAAILARQLQADRLVLCKSVGTTGPLDLEQATLQEWVDPAFETQAAGLHVEWVNLRCDPLTASLG